MVRILLVDEHPVVREGLKTVLSSDEGLSVVGQAGSAGEAIRLVGRCDPDVVLLDLGLGGVSGRALCARLSRARPELRIIVLGTHGDHRTLTEAFGAGAHGFLMKTASPSRVVQAVRATLDGGTFIDPAVAKPLVEMALGRPTRGPFDLTARELDVLRLFPTGLSYISIAESLGVSPETVRTHARSIRRKLGVRSKVMAASVALRQGLALPHGGKRERRLHRPENEGAGLLARPLLLFSLRGAIEP